jgi:exopolysaccharide biosynthesis polyprenyl glycosylphosphotransferase
VTALDVELNSGVAVGDSDIRAKTGPMWEAQYRHSAMIADALVALLAGVLAFMSRFGDVNGTNRQYLIASILLPVGWLCAVGLARAYEPRFLFVGPEEYQRVLLAGISVIAGVAIASYAARLDIARGYVVVALPSVTIGTLASRYAMRKWLHRRRTASGAYMRKVLLVGYERTVASLARQLHRERYHGMQVVGACVPQPSVGNVGVPIFGSFDEVDTAVASAGADTVAVLACPEFDAHALRRLAWQLEKDDIDLIVAPALMDVAGPRTTIRPVDGLPLLHVEHPDLSGGRRLVKALFDRVGAGTILLLGLPALIAIAIAIRVTGDGPVLFSQERVGRGGRTFRLYKFRSMRVGAESDLAELVNESDGVLFKIRHDPRITPLGRWLRRHSLDELPQLINVLAGQMSLVGPRPPLPAEVAQYGDDVRRRLVVKPGLTGLWQVSGRSDLSWEESVRLDLRYVENWSLALDLQILWRTVFAVAKSSGAY